jgi:hypothetical protein
MELEGKVWRHLPALNLQLKMPPALVARCAPSLLRMEGVRFSHGRRQVDFSLAAGTALIHRFSRDDHIASGWLVHDMTRSGSMGSFTGKTPGP